MFFESSRIFANRGGDSPFAERQQIQEAPAGTGSEPGQQAVQRRQPLRMAAHQVREDGHGREDAAPIDQREPRPSRQLQIFADRTIARMLVFRRRANQTSAEQELHPRLEVREIGHRDEQFAAGRGARGCSSASARG